MEALKVSPYRFLQPDILRPSLALFVSVWCSMFLHMSPIATSPALLPLLHTATYIHTATYCDFNSTTTAAAAETKPTQPRQCWMHSLRQCSPHRVTHKKHVWVGRAEVAQSQKHAKKNPGPPQNTDAMLVFPGVHVLVGWQGPNRAKCQRKFACDTAAPTCLGGDSSHHCPTPRAQNPYR